MDLKITEKKEEALLSRVKLKGEVVFEAATPSYEEVKKKISSSINCDEKLIVIRNLYTNFGIKKADIYAYVYNDEKSMKNIEPKPKEKKAKAGEGAAPVEAAKPAEEKKEPVEEEKPKQKPKAKEEEKK